MKGYMLKWKCRNADVSFHECRVVALIIHRIIMKNPSSGHITPGYQTISPLVQLSDSFV